MLPLEHAAASPPQRVFMEAAAKGEVAKASCDQDAHGHRVQSAWAWLRQPEGHVRKEDGCSHPAVALLMGGAALAGGLCVWEGQETSLQPAPVQGLALKRNAPVLQPAV